MKKTSSKSNAKPRVSLKQRWEEARRQEEEARAAEEARVEKIRAMSLVKTLQMELTEITALVAVTPTSKEMIGMMSGLYTQMDAVGRLWKNAAQTAEINSTGANSGTNAQRS